ncbi:MAG TPA: flagellar hook-associated protein FlgK [Ignavibacteriaceae bacterium]|nr:flagellar hook-associated protein FlgK [Ignavibacteriaceae bacterium]
MGLSNIFDIATRSLSVYQGALDVTAQNISNASNPDYSRQTVVLGTETPQQLGGFLWGTGVKLEDISRVNNALTDQQIRDNNSKYSNYNESNVTLGQVQNLLNEPSDQGISSLTTAFLNSWQQLSVTPNSVSLRQNVVQAAQSLSDQIQTVRQGMDSVQTSLKTQISSDVNSINSDLQQIQSLNAQIFQLQTAGQSPNDLLDTRDKVINDLSNQVNINVNFDSQNMANISIGGVFAADKVTAVQFKTSLQNGKLAVTTKDGAVRLNLTGGQLYADTNVYNNKIPSYENSLDTFVNNLMQDVNSQHASGYTLDNPPQTGINFFDSYSNGTLKINSQILNDPNKIAVSSDGTSGNGDIALNIAGLSTQKQSDGTTLLDNYSSLVSQIGTDVQSATNTANSYNLVSQQLQQQKASYSGVSVDEEMTNVIQYQKSYTASAKLITVADQMLQTLLDMVS